MDVDAASAVDLDGLTIATFNIWFDSHHAEQRYLAIAEILRELAPDVVALQEVTPAALDIFLSRQWVRDEYLHAPVVGGDNGNYGMLMLSRVPMSRVTYTRLPSRQSRGFLSAELAVDGGRQGRLLPASRQRQVVGAAARLAVAQDFPHAEDSGRCCAGW